MACFETIEFLREAWRQSFRFPTKVKAVDFRQSTDRSWLKNCLNFNGKVVFCFATIDWSKSIKASAFRTKAQKQHSSRSAFVIYINSLFIDHVDSDEMQRIRARSVLIFFVHLVLWSARFLFVVVIFQVTFTDFLRNVFDVILNGTLPGFIRAIDK